VPKPVVVEIAHELGRAEAGQRLRGGFGKIRNQLGVGVLNFEEQWVGDQLHFAAGALGQKISGRVEVMDTSVRIELDLPWALAVLAERLQHRVRHAGALLLEKK
jgi:hypothetical protein